MSKIHDVYDYINTFAPFNLQQEWDNSDLIIGDMENDVSKILVCLDITDKAVSVAVKNKVNLIISHHPLIMNGAKFIGLNSAIAKLIKNNINVISAHTNFDAANGGMNDILCDILGIENAKPIDENLGTIPRIGQLKSEICAKDFAKFVKDKLGCDVVRLSGGRSVRKIMICGGGGASYIPQAITLGADLFLLGEAKHHEYLHANENGLAILDAGHFYTENIFTNFMAQKISKQFSDVEVLTTTENAPYTTI